MGHFANTIYLDEKLCMLVYMVMIRELFFCDGFLWSNNSLDDQKSFFSSLGHYQSDQNYIRIFSIIIDIVLERTGQNLCFC